MSEQSCGTCRYFEPMTPPNAGYCIWSDTHPVPYVMERAYWVTWNFDGALCQLWQAKQDPPP